MPLDINLYRIVHQDNMNFILQNGLFCAEHEHFDLNNRFIGDSIFENVNLFVANKLAYFLQRLGEPLRLTFQKAAYGPYSPQVGHVLYQLNGTYLKGLEQNEAKAFEPLMLDYDAYSLIINEIQMNISIEQQARLKTLQQLMEGFESFFALEVLASIDFLRQKDAHLSMNDLKKGLAEWSPRKAAQMSENYIQIALNRLEAFTLLNC